MGQTCRRTDGHRPLHRPCSIRVAYYAGIVSKCMQEAFILFHIYFYSRCDMLALYSHGPVSVCLSQFGVLSKWMNGQVWFLAWRLLSTSPRLCSEEIPQNQGTSPWNFFLNSGLRKFRHSISIVERAINLAGERWTLRG